MFQVKTIKFTANLKVVQSEFKVTWSKYAGAVLGIDVF